MTRVNLPVKQKQTHRHREKGKGEGEGWLGSLGLVDVNSFI